MIWLNPIMALATPEEPWVLVVDHHSIRTYKKKPRLSDNQRFTYTERSNPATYHGEAEFTREEFIAAQQTDLAFGARFLLIKGET